MYNLINKAIKKNNLEIILNSNENQLLNLDEWGNSALHLAAEKGKLSIIQLLIEKKKFPKNIKNYRNYTALHNAALKNHSQVIEYLLNCGVNDKVCTVYQQLAIHKAAQFGYLESVSSFIKFDKEIIKTKGYLEKTLLIISVESHNLDLVKYLVEVAGCPVDENCGKGSTALRSAAVLFQKGKKEISLKDALSIWRYLIDKGADCFSKKYRNGKAAYEMLIFGSPLKQMFETAFQLKLAIKDMKDVEILKIFQKKSLFNQKYLDFYYNIPLNVGECSDEQLQFYLAFQEFKYLYNKYCLWRSMTNIDIVDVDGWSTNSKNKKKNQKKVQIPQKKV